MSTAKDPWHYPRDELAQQFLSLFGSNLASALTLFAPRRKGKTEFLRKDMTPIAEKEGWRVFYFSFLDAGDDSATQFAHALNQFAQPTGLVKKAAKALSKIGKVSGEAAGLKAEIELNQEHGTPGVKHSIQQLAENKQPVVLLLDEIQALASKKHTAFIASLRTALDMHKDRVKVIFTGSSRDGLRRLFSTSTAPFFHYSQNLQFPDLGRGFTDHLADVYHQATQRTLDQEQIWQAFVELQRSPQFIRSLVERLTLNPSLSIEAAKQQLLEEVIEHQDFASQWGQLSMLEQLLLNALSHTAPEFYSQSFKSELAHALGLGEEAISTATIQNALRSLQRKSLIHAEGQGRYVIEDAMLKDWIRHHFTTPDT